MLNDLLAKNQSSDKLFVEDVFSTYLYTGNDSTQTITNGIDLAGKGGMVWLKDRSSALANQIFDTARGATKVLVSNGTDSSTTESTSLTSFNSNGFTLGSYFRVNASPDNYASWTFRKAPKFFDVVTWTGNNTSGRQISHSLGVTPGMIIIKNITGGTYWAVWHRSIGATDYLSLNTTDAASTLSSVFNAAPTSTYFQVGNSWWVNGDSSNQYVAYLFAHDTTADGVIQCGSYTGTSASNPINLGWEPQFLLIKRTDGVASWYIQDVMRDMSQTNTRTLSPNTSSAEYDNAGPIVFPTATGFDFASGGYSGWNQSGFSYIYLAIRRGPMRVPTDATKVFNSVTRSTNGTATTVTANLSPVDLVINGVRTSWGGGESNATFDRLRGTPILRTNNTSSELTNDAFYGFDVQQGYRLGPDTDGWGTNNTYYGTLNTVLWNFRRAPGFFDVTCYSGTGATLSVGHNLGVVPELIILKRRNASSSWPVWRTATGTGTTFGYLNDSGAEADQGVSILTASPTSSAFSVGAWGPINASGGTYVAYLFASCPGVSKVGTYTGTGTTLQINCGFTNGARFVLIKRTDSTGGWHVWDSARGIVAGNDPYLLLNSPTAEVTNTDYVDAYSAGFELSSTAPAALNANGGTYIYLAIA